MFDFIGLVKFQVAKDIERRRMPKSPNGSIPVDYQYLNSAHLPNCQALM
jgi:hypothetical protein